VGDSLGMGDVWTLPSHIVGLGIIQVSTRHVKMEKQILILDLSTSREMDVWKVLDNIWMLFDI
jgi:hypothetical protein